MNENALIYEYAVVRYVPHVEREEFINVGLLMMCKRRRWLRTEVRLNTMRLAALAPDVDIEALRQQLRMFDASARTLGDVTVEERFRWLAAVKSSAIQTSRPHPGLIECEESAAATELLEATFRRLMTDLVP